jgi:hypothetical protein
MTDAMNAVPDAVELICSSSGGGASSSGTVSTALVSMEKSIPNGLLDILIASCNSNRAHLSQELSYR